MAKRSNDSTPAVATLEPAADGAESAAAVEETRPPATPAETAERPATSPSVPDPAPDPPKHPPHPAASTPTVIERFRVEASVYYVPHLGFGAIYVPSGTIVTRESHDVQRLIEQGAKLRPLLD